MNLQQAEFWPVEKLLFFFKPPLNNSSNRATVSVKPGTEQGITPHTAVLWNKFHQVWLYLKHIWYDHAHASNAQKIFSMKITLALRAHSSTPVTGWRYLSWGTNEFLINITVISGDKKYYRHSGRCGLWLLRSLGTSKGPHVQQISDLHPSNLRTTLVEGPPPLECTSQPSPSASPFNPLIVNQYIPTCGSIKTKTKKMKGTKKI